MKIILIVLVLSSLTSCAYNKHLKSVVADLQQTEKCSTTNILLHPRDTKETLKGKVIILNSKLDCHDDSDYTDQIKLDSYKDI